MQSMKRYLRCGWIGRFLVVSACVTSSCSLFADPRESSSTIRRDTWGVAHIHGKTHADAFFGMGYAQAEDYFWQLEDTCIQSLGRYAEVNGEEGLDSDVLNRSFEIVPRAQADFHRMKPAFQRMATAFVDGINHYLNTHPEETPRLITKFEPWHVLAMDRFVILNFVYGQIHVGKPKPRSGDDVASLLKRRNWNAWDLVANRPTGFDHEVREAIGSNAWAIAGSKTKSGRPMLFINPHQPWYGMGQFYEVHLSSDEGLNFTGACFFGNPFPTIGHNEFLGWTYTVNNPDIGDAWRVTFDHESDPLKYRYDGGYRTAREWSETVLVKKGERTISQQVRFRRTHHGPVVRPDGENRYLAAQVAGLYDLDRVNQAWGMVLSQNFDQWKKAFSLCAIPMFNVVYADRDGNIFYAYNGAIPIRDEKFNWRRPVDGSNPNADWKGIHPFSDLPQLLNPKCGYVQSCNSTPFTTTHAENPERKRFPAYMIEDADVDMRRSKLSRSLLQEASEVTYDQWKELAYDTRLYWPMTEIPNLNDDFRNLQAKNPDLAERVRPYFRHLQNWDFRSTVESTQTTLAVAWYEQLYGFGYPAESLKPQFRNDRLTWFQALDAAAEKVKSLYGDWKHPWGEAHRLQRVANQPNVKHAGVGLNSLFDSLPCPGTPGPLGIVFTVYSTPEIPLLRSQRFAVVGASYMAVVEFSDDVRADSIMPFGASGRRRSPHFFDQAQLYSSRRFKPAWYREDEIRPNTSRTLELHWVPLQASERPR